jgi:anaerobic selenocysteine-containing dehydrogenase
LPDLRGTCSLEVTVDADEDGVLSIEPDRLNPNTWRDFCRKGKTAAEVVEHPRRVLTPMRRVDDRNEAATYEDAIGDIADRLNRIMARRVVVPLFVPPTKSAVTSAPGTAFAQGGRKPLQITVRSPGRPATYSRRWTCSRSAIH